ncbi:hypothetical protein HYPSUDRAFT_94250, partial [Hypholoma sublateritium FD-334 SS-4]
ACGRTFVQMNAYSNHVGSCRHRKKRMASALEVAKEKYRHKKSRLEITATIQPLHPEGSSQQLTAPAIFERRPRRENRRLPLRYRTEQPAAPASLPPVEHIPLSTSNITPPLASVAPLRRILKSSSNVFGIFRQYLATSFPEHDPDSNTQAADLSDVAVDHDEAVNSPTSLFRPYPNQNAFLLGEWYWNNGTQTQESFQKLVDIISGDDFNPADVRNVAWNSLDRRLGESNDSEDVWLDEPDAGWKETLITMSIPFRQK